MPRLDTPPHEDRHIRDYMACEAPGEEVTHIEKVQVRHVDGERHTIWDVWTTDGRWWVVDPLMNLYSQSDFKSLDVALTFHVGLRHRMSSRNGRRLPAYERRVLRALRKFEQAAEALNDAEETEEFQAVGVRLREGLIALVKALAPLVKAQPRSEQPKAGDFVGWLPLILGEIAPGPSLARVRSHMLGNARTTWQLVNWLTHAEGVDRDLAEIVHSGCYQAVDGVLTLARRAARGGGPRTCPACGSLRVAVDFRSAVGDSYLICEACDWQQLERELH